MPEKPTLRCSAKYQMLGANQPKVSLNVLECEDRRFYIELDFGEIPLAERVVPTSFVFPGSDRTLEMAKQSALGIAQHILGAPLGFHFSWDS